MKKRRNIRTQRRKLFYVICGLLFLSAVIGFSCHRPAAAALNSDTVKYYTNVQVDAGDSLWAIADKYMPPEYGDKNAYIKEIKQINGLRSDQILQGSYLHIPYYAETH